MIREDHARHTMFYHDIAEDCIEPTTDISQLSAQLEVNLQWTKSV